MRKFPKTTKSYPSLFAPKGKDFLNPYLFGRGFNQPAHKIGSEKLTSGYPHEVNDRGTVSPTPTVDESLIFAIE